MHTLPQAIQQQADIKFACVLSPRLGGQLPETKCSFLRNQQLLFKFLHPALLLQSHGGQFICLHAQGPDLR